MQLLRYFLRYLSLITESYDQRVYLLHNNLAKLDPLFGIVALLRLKLMIKKNPYHSV